MKIAKWKLVAGSIGWPVRERTGKRVDEDFSDVSDRGTNVVVVICRAKDLLVFSNEVRQADIPPSE
jgi:hypothetical protein